MSWQPGRSAEVPVCAAGRGTTPAAARARGKGQEQDPGQRAGLLTGSNPVP